MKTFLTVIPAPPVSHLLPSHPSDPFMHKLSVSFSLIPTAPSSRMNLVGVPGREGKMTLFRAKDVSFRFHSEKGWGTRSVKKGWGKTNHAKSGTSLSNPTPTDATFLRFAEASASFLVDI